MSDRMDAELAELAYDEAEGAAEAMDEGDEFDVEAFDDDFDAGDEFDLGEEDPGDEFEAFDESDFGDEFDEDGFDEFDDEGDEFDAGDEFDLEEAMAVALGAEDTDEFFGRIMSAVRRIAPVVGQVARVAAPIASAIPLPFTQAAAPALRLLGQLKAEGANEEEALDAFAELAAYDEAVLPVVAGIAARAAGGAKLARAPLAARRAVVKTISRTGTNLVRRHGKKSARAIPAAVKSVRRAAAVRRTPARARPRLVGRTLRRVSRSRGLTRRLARPNPAARARVRRAVRRGGVGVRGYRGGVGIRGGYGGGVGGGIGRPGYGVGGGRRPRSWTINGPVRITVQSI